MQAISPLAYPIGYWEPIESPPRIHYCRDCGEQLQREDVEFGQCDQCWRIAEDEREGGDGW